MTNKTDTDIFFMRKALFYAKKAFKRREVPIGAVIVRDEEIISYGYNMKESKNVATRHAEIIAIERACKALDNWRLIDATLYVNVEPCVMCAGAILQARIKRVVYGCADSKFGACESLYAILNDSRQNHRCTVTKGVLEDESIAMLKEFFRELRK